MCEELSQRGWMYTPAAPLPECSANLGFSRGFAAGKEARLLGASVGPRLPGGQALVAWPTCSTRTAAAFVPSSARGGITTVTCARAQQVPLHDVQAAGEK